MQNFGTSVTIIKGIQISNMVYTKVKFTKDKFLPDSLATELKISIQEMFTIYKQFDYNYNSNSKYNSSYQY